MKLFVFPESRQFSLFQTVIHQHRARLTQAACSTGADKNIYLLQAPTFSCCMSLFLELGGLSAKIEHNN